MTVAERIATEFRHQHLIGFMPVHPEDGKFHRLRVTVTGCACQMRARAGFVAEKRNGP